MLKAKHQRTNTFDGDEDAEPPTMHIFTKLWIFEDTKDLELCSERIIVCLILNDYFVTKECRNNLLTFTLDIPSNMTKTFLMMKKYFILNFRNLLWKD